jgi:subtilase family serine protease
MLRARTFTAIASSAAVVAGLSLAGTSAAAAAPGPARIALPGSVASFASSSRAIGNVAATQRLTIQVWLRPRTDAAQRYATAVSTPGSALFHHYLSPAAYTARFGASKAVEGKVAAWLRSQGFTAIKADSGRSYVRATGPVSKIDQAFRTQLRLYRSTAKVNAGGYALRANSKPVTIPSSLAGFVIGVTGLTNAAPVLPLQGPRDPNGPTEHTSAAKNAKCSQYYGQHIATGLKEIFGRTSFPTEGCGYTAQQLRSAYGANTVNTGKGQTVALIELGLTKDMFLTLKDYAKVNGLPAPSSSRYQELSIGQGTQCGDDFDVEEQLDVEVSYAMAPGANQLVVGGDSCNDGDFGDQGLFDADLAVLDGNGGRPLASAASNSWESEVEGQPAVDTNIENAFLVRAAAEGVGMYFSAGDGPGLLAPSDDPYAVAVGGTTLGIGRTGQRLFETGWSTGYYLYLEGQWLDFGEGGGTGGGPSLLWREPAYQHGVVPTALTSVAGNRGGPVRSVPDISADADPFTGMAVGLLAFSAHKAPAYAEEDVGGTSLASPLVAGMVTAAQQGQAKPFGFTNPVFYKLLGTSAVTDALPLTSKSPAVDQAEVCTPAECGGYQLGVFDDQNHDLPGYLGQVTLKGYDNMTGVGTPDGQAFITALRRLEK